MADFNIPEPSPGWGEEATDLWREVWTYWDLGPDGFSMLQIACDSLNRYHEARMTLQRDGLTFTTSGGQIKKHPCLEVVKNERAGFLSAMRSLDLENIGQEKRPGPGSPTYFERMKKEGKIL